MLSHYQTMKELEKIRTIIERIHNQDMMDALEFAIDAAGKHELSEPCAFDLGNECRALLEKRCGMCKFRKTKKQVQIEGKITDARLKKLDKDFKKYESEMLTISI